MRLYCLMMLFIATVVTGQERQFDIDILAETFGFDEQTPIAVDRDSLIQACPSRDCIPSIDTPEFVSSDQADFVADDDLVLAVALNGVLKAYPTKILIHHEIVNDDFDGEPVAVTYCPLCGSGVAFEGKLDGEPVEFGVSGVLHESDLVLYDRNSETLWAQVTGAGMMGPKTGEQLQEVPLVMTEWRTWRQQHPDTLVLSTNTGFDKDYTVDRYADYRESDRLFLPVSASDARLHVKKVIYGVMVDEQPVAYEAEWLKSKGEYVESINDQMVEIKYNNDGSVTAANPNTGKNYPVKRLFWFAWYTFHPHTLLRMQQPSAGS